jgi:hypothetical protein
VPNGKLEPGGWEQAEPHATGISDNLLIARGGIVLELGANKHLLDEGTRLRLLRIACTRTPIVERSRQ